MCIRDSQYEAAVDRRHPTQGDARQLHQHTVVILGKKRYRVLNLAGQRNRGSVADVSVAGGIDSVVRGGGAQPPTVLREETDPQNTVETGSGRACIGVPTSTG